MKDVNKLGFSVDNTADENSRILQEAVLNSGDIYIGESGIYKMNKCVVIGDDTSIYFGAGVYIKREKCMGETSYVFVNSGAYNGKVNKNISIHGLKLITDGVQSDVPDANTKTVVPGLRGHLSFYNIKNLKITDIEMLDIPEKDFGIHICSFENVVIEDVRIEGKKDAVHFGCGSKFVVRHGIFKTFDDPIALNAHDYASSNPTLGWIEDGLIEDCYDLDDDSTTGFFCRILAGSWCDWYEGMEIQHSDSVVCNGRVYRAFMKPDGTKYKSMIAPSHEAGMCVVDGINWIPVCDKPIYNCGCRNVHFKDIHIKKKRPTAFSIHFDKDKFSRSYYPNSEAPVQSNLTFENVISENDIPVFLNSITPVDTVRIINSDISNGQFVFKNIKTEGIVYPETDIMFMGTKGTCKKSELLKLDEDMEVQMQFVMSSFED